MLQEIDMSITSMSIDEVREEGQEFSIPYYLGYSLVMYKKPDRTSTRSMYIMPFKYNVSFYWWLVRVTLVVAFGFFCPKIFGGGANLRIVILLEKECSFSAADNVRS